MRKGFLIFILITILTTVSCQSNQDANPNDGSLKEFSHIPSYENMELVNYSSADSKEGMDRGDYTVKNVDHENFLVEYEKILNEAGWETIEDSKPYSLNLEKDEYLTIVIVQEKDDSSDLSVSIFSRKMTD